MKLSSRPRTVACGLSAVLLGLLSTSGARADTILVTNYYGNTLGEYATPGRR